MIDKFDDEYAFLSNFYPSKVFLDGIEFPTVENAFQAAKTLDQNERLSFVNLTPGQAKRHGREITLRSDWEDVKIFVMKDLVHQKFFNHFDLASKLLMTNDQGLIEGNEWNDTFWGVCNGIGENYLGIMLMTVRTDLREQYEV